MEIITQQKSSGEMAASASAALAKSTIEAQFSVALARPRSTLQARTRILEACARRGFAESAKWSLPRGGQNITGFSIRFAESALQAWGNVDVRATIAYEDEDKRMVRIAVTDLETNISYTDEVVMSKTLERKKLAPGQVSEGKRVNSKGEDVYIVRATDEDLMLKVNSAKSKSIRTSGLRLIPQDILDEAWDAIDAAMSKGGVDPQLQVKKIADGFAGIGVQVVDLESYLGHSLRTCSPKELADLRGIYTSIKDGEASWGDYVKKADPIPAGATSAPTADVKAAAAKQAKPDSSSDEIPMDFSAPKPAVVVDESKPAAVSPQDALWALVQAAKGTFEHLVSWLKDQGDLPANAEPADLNEIPNAVCDKWARAPRLVLKGIQAAKGGAK